jgi:hypothetical protein
MRRRVGAAACAIALAPLAHGVTLNPRGLGQVLIYPYYTVNAGFGTLLSVVNTTPNGKALKLRFHEGRNGRTVFSLNIYLSPSDAWVAQVYSSGDENSVAAIATNDSSCVVPAFLLPVDPGSGPPRANFGNNDYSGANADGGPTDLARTREGYFDVIEMGEVTDAAQNTLTAITHDQDGIPASCAQVQAAWSAPGGYWGQNAQTDLAPPTGGLYGAESIINVADGLMYTIDATAIDGFSDAIQHTGPGDAAPDFDTASPDAGGMIAAFVPFDGKLIEADFAKSEDAISALFMVDNLYNEYVVDPGVGAQSDWMITFPTKRFYTDKALLSAGADRASPPFDVQFTSANGGTSCVPIREQFFNREENSTASCAVLCQPPPPTELCYATSPLTIGAVNSSLGSSLLIKDLSEVDLSGVGFTSGWLRTDFSVDMTGATQTNHALTSINGVKLLGLPALGFLALDYVNGNATPGVLANYSGAYAHRAHVTCMKASDDSPCQ